MSIDCIISDADGVLVDSKKLAWKNAHKIVSLFYDVEPFQNILEYKKHFGRESQIRLVGERESDTLRSMHRLLMRYNSKEIKTFQEVIEIYRYTKVEKKVVTSALSSGIKLILGENQSVFTDVLGREIGRKSEILKTIIKGNEIYVTDSVRDIDICKKIELPVIAVGWGYDQKEDLILRKPDYFAETPLELKKLFEEFKLY